MTKDEIAKLIPDNVLREIGGVLRCEQSKTLYRDALAAGLAAWGGMEVREASASPDEDARIILPIEEPTP